MDDLQKKIADLKKRWELHQQESIDRQKKELDRRVARWHAEAVDSVLLGAMLECPKTALREAASPTSVQKMAIEILRDYWKVCGTTEVLQTLQDVIAICNDDSVRLTAIGAVSSGLAGSKDLLWLRLLAESVLDESESTAIRLQAYLALFLIAREDLPIERNFSAMEEFRERFPFNIDLRFVGRCRNGG